MTRSGAIGVFDSGVGGLTVVRALQQALPYEDIVYLGDTARVPYGSKSPRTVERYSLSCQRFLLDRGVKLVMVACNTASANALEVLEEATDLPVIGAVNPGAKSAVEASAAGRIGVLGTLSTIQSQAYDHAIAALAPHATVTALACPMLVPLAEEGWLDRGAAAEHDDIATAIVRRYLGPLFDSAPDIDTLVLGCTHYPLLAKTIGSVATALAGHAVAIVDSASAMADVAHTLLPEPDHNAPRGSLHCYVTDASRLDELGPRFLGRALDHFDVVDL